MTDQHQFTLRQIDQTRTDFRHDRKRPPIPHGPARPHPDPQGTRNTLGIIFATAMLTTLAVLWFTGFWRYCL
jgi:hypothetical protein